MSKLTDQDLADWRAKRTGKPTVANLANNLAQHPAPATPTPATPPLSLVAVTPVPQASHGMATVVDGKAYPSLSAACLTEGWNYNDVYNTLKKGGSSTTVINGKQVAVAAASPTLLNWPPAAPHKQHHHTVQSLTVDAATAVIGAGSSSRNILEVIREVMRRSTLVLCPADIKDPTHVRELLSALEAFARFECAYDQTMSGCTDCPSVGCTPL
ncbi:MAG: hypothetical protein E6Q87_01465 [Cellvibrionales bacterium]|nr:MAG: hypothetical protein E6Q87_01465 [Cellvibrionales bacterium]